MRKLVITGYSSNIVRALIKQIEDEQLTVEYCGRGSDADVTFDFANFEDCLGFARRIKEIKPDYLFLNHGFLPGKKLTEYSAETLTAAINVNLISVALILEQIVDIPNLNTVVMSSISGKAGSYDTVYAATKAGVDVLVRSHATRIASGSRLNAISPGIIEDAKMTTVRKDLHVLAAKKDQTPTKSFCTSDEIARIAQLLLFTPGNMNGENININGGMYVG